VRLRRRPASRGKKKRKGGREADRWGPGVSDSKIKRKERGRGGPVRGRLDGPAGLAGPKGEQVRFFSFFFFSKLLFKTIFLFKFKSNFFKLFSRIL
jgi:hypothetical protein